MGVHEPCIILCMDLFPKWDLHGVSAGRKVSFLTSRGLLKRLGMVWHHHCVCMCICTCVSRHGPVAWCMSTWLGSLKSSWCGLVFFLLETVDFLIICLVLFVCLFVCLVWSGFCFCFKTCPMYFGKIHVKSVVFKSSSIFFDPNPLISQLHALRDRSNLVLLYKTLVYLERQGGKRRGRGGVWNLLLPY